MAQHMKDRVVALAGPRKAADMAKLVEKMGGTAVFRPAQGTVFLMMKCSGVPSKPGSRHLRLGRSLRRESAWRPFMIRPSRWACWIH